MADKPEALVYRCWCGRTYFVAPWQKHTECECGVAHFWPAKVKTYVKDEDGDWQETERHCEACSKPLLDEQVAWMDAEGVILCAGCAPKAEQPEGGREE